MTCLYGSLLYSKWLLWFEELPSRTDKPAILPNINSNLTEWKKKSFRLLFNLHASCSAPPVPLQHGRDRTISLGSFVPGERVRYQLRGNEKQQRQLTDHLSVYLYHLDSHPAPHSIRKYWKCPWVTSSTWVSPRKQDKHLPTNSSKFSRQRLP